MSAVIGITAANMGRSLSTLTIRQLIPISILVASTFVRIEKTGKSWQFKPYPLVKHKNSKNRVGRPMLEGSV